MEATLFTKAPASTGRAANSGHRLRWSLAALAALVLIAVLIGYGYSYYTAPLADRAHSPLHQQLRPSGEVGLKIGALGAVLFLLIYLYPIRKRWRRLRSLGNTRHWLDFHVLMGVAAPLLITLHSSFRFHGIAGMAFWVMWAVVASGVVGRYLYGQIPRHVSAAEMTLQEIGAAHDELGANLDEQALLTPEEIRRLFDLPAPAAIQAMSTFQALMVMLRTDLLRPLQVARLRRKSLPLVKRLLSLWGFLPFGDPEFERVIALVRRKAWLSTKIVFLGKVQRIFHLWHVVHRPFSYSFAVLIVLHISFVILMGYRW